MRWAVAETGVWVVRRLHISQGPVAFALGRHTPVVAGLVPTFLASALLLFSVHTSYFSASGLHVLFTSFHSKICSTFSP